MSSTLGSPSASPRTTTPRSTTMSPMSPRISRKRRTSVVVVFGGGGGGSGAVLKREAVPRVLAEEILKDASHHGIIIKQGGSVKTWKRRLAILHQGNFYYYVKKTDKQPRGMICISGLKCAPLDEQQTNSIGRPFGIKIISPARTYYICCDSQQERERWVNAITESAAYGSPPAIHVLSVDGDTDFQSLDQIVGTPALNARDIVVLRPGKYCMSLSRPVLIQHEMEIRGVGNDEKDYIVHNNGGDMSQQPALFVVDCGEQHINTVRVSYMTFEGSSTQIFHVRQGTLELDGCRLRAMNSTLILISGNANVVVFDCTFAGGGSNHPAIVVEENASITICQCIFEDIGDSAVVVRGSATAKISETLFSRCSRGVLVDTDNTDDPVAIQKCRFVGIQNDSILLSSTSSRDSLQQYNNEIM